MLQKALNSAFSSGFFLLAAIGSVGSMQVVSRALNNKLTQAMLRLTAKPDLKKSGSRGRMTMKHTAIE
jgi:hypothetical protein